MTLTAEAIRPITCNAVFGNLQIIDMRDRDLYRRFHRRSNFIDFPRFKGCPN
jgi:hypothetical protein